MGEVGRGHAGGRAEDCSSRATPRRVGAGRPGDDPAPRLPPDGPSRPSRRRSSSSSGAGSAESTAPSSTGSCGKSDGCSSGTRSSGRSRTPLIRARMRERWGHYKWQRWAKEFLKEQAGLRRYVLESSSAAARCPRESSSTRRPGCRTLRLVGHPRPADVDARAPAPTRRDRRRRPSGGQRLWDLAERWYPETETVPLAEHAESSTRSASARSA